jgi:hypothetical protein
MNTDRLYVTEYDIAENNDRIEKVLKHWELFLNNTPSLFVGQIFICGDR